jgi:hypothetical protein
MCTQAAWNHPLVHLRKWSARRAGHGINRLPLMNNGERVRLETCNMATVHFPFVGQQFVDTGAGAVCAVRGGDADAMLFSTRDLVSFAESYLRRVLR